MLNGFEDIICDLTTFEKQEVAVALARILSCKQGKNMATTNAKLREELRDKGYRVSDAKLRALINFIRITGMVERVIANSDGYYIAQNHREVLDYCDSLRGREASIREVRQALESQNTKSLFN